MHLKPDELIDLAEGVRADLETPHLSTCTACQRQLADLRAALRSVAEGAVVEVPEPSPLFWDHFSGRVREAVAAEGSPRRREWFGTWGRSRWLSAAPLASAAAMVVVVLIALAGYITTPRVPASTASDAAKDTALLPLGANDDPTLALVADLTADLDLDAAGEAGLTVPTHAGGADDVVSLLSDGERRELRRLLQEELAKPHA
jgi:hypothetical protein